MLVRKLLSYWVLVTFQGRTVKLREKNTFFKFMIDLDAKVSGNVMRAANIFGTTKHLEQFYYHGMASY